MGTEGRAKEWRETIAAVRLATGAPLTYASNWAAGAPRVPFWDAVDLFGVSAYFTVTGPEATVDEARKSWASVRVRMYTWSSKRRVSRECG